MEDSVGARNLPPDLTHKVIYAAMRSDAFSEDEELAVIRALV